MQRVPGLRPTGQLPLRPAPVRSRVPTPDPEQQAPPRLQPVAQPVDTYVRPQVPPEDNNLASLAEALSGLNPQLYTFFERRQRGSTTDALEYLQQTSIEEVNRLVRNGETPAVLQTREGRRVYGEARARADAERIRSLYTTEFRAQGGSLQDLINEVTGESFELYGEDDTFMATYTAVFDPLRNEILGQYAQDLAAEEMENRAADVFSAWSYRIEDGLRAGEDPSLITQSIFADFPNNRDFLNLPYKEQQGYLLQLASQQAAAGNYDMARSLINMERVDGPYRGSLRSDPNTGEAAAQLLSQMERAEVADANRVAEDQAYEAIIDEAVLAGEQGSILTMGSRTIVSADGSTRTISQDEIQRVAADRALQNLAQAADYNGWTEEQATAEEIEYFATSGLPHPVWVSGWRDSSAQLSLQNISENNIPSDVTQSFQQYRTMSAENYHYIAAHLDERQRSFFDLANLLMEGGHVRTEGQALQQAAIATMGMSPTDGDARANFQRLNEAATRVVNNSDHWTGIGWQATNTTDVKRQLSRFTTLYMLAGLGEEAALSAATQTFERNNTNVLQAFVQNDPRIDMAQFKGLAESYAADFLERNPDLDWEYDLGDLSIRQVGNGPGAYQIVDANTGIGLVGFEGFEFSTQSLEQWDLERQEAQRDAALAATVAGSAETEAQRAADTASEDAARRASGALGESIGVIP